MLELPPSLLDQVLAHARSGYPLETCGLLAGTAPHPRDPASRIRATGYFPIENLDQSAVSYRMDPRQQLAAEHAIHRAESSPIAICHCHPASPSFPSQTDLDRAHWEGTDDLLYPERLHLILSLQDPNRPVFRCFRFCGRRLLGDIEEITITVPAVA